MTRRSPLRAAAKLASGLAAGALILGLGGCVTLFPKEAPSPLYRFGESVPESTAGGSAFGVRMSGIGFDQAASGDAIMTITGDEIAYVSGGRWAAPASTLFAAAVRKGFDGGSVRLLQPGEAGQAPYVLRLDVSRFEARYDHGATAAPTIKVQVHATLVRAADQTLVGSRDFEATSGASENRVGSIAEAFDQATGQVVSQLVMWVDQAPSGGA